MANKGARQHKRGKDNPVYGGKIVNDDFIEAFCHPLSLGMSITRTCGLFRLSPQTFKRWMKEAQDDPEGETAYGKLKIAVDHARAGVEYDAVKCLKSAVKEGQLEDRKWTGKDGEEKESKVKRQDWRAAAFILERRFPEEWMRREQVQHDGEVTHVKRLVIDTDEFPENKGKEPIGPRVKGGDPKRFGFETPNPRKN